MAGPDDTTKPPAIPDVFDASDARAELDDAKALAAEIRQKTFDHYTERSNELELQRDELARKAWANRQEANAADMQVQREQATIQRAEEHMKNWEKEALGGDSQALSDYEHSRALAQRAQARIDAAKAKAEELRADADVADKEVVRLEDESMKLYDEYHYLADQAEHIELRASMDQSAVEDLAKAEAADAQAAELRARGDITNAEKFEKQAAEHRADADRWVKEYQGRVDDEKLAEIGIDVDERFADADTIVNPIEDPFAPPAEEPAPEPGAVPPGTKVIDMEPEVIEVTPPKVIDMEPEVIEVPAPGTPTKVIDMEPEIIEVTPPKVIDMEPEIIEVTPPQQPAAPAAAAASATDVRAEADLAIDTAGKVRDAIFEQNTTKYVDLTLERDAEARKAWGLKQEAEAADMQVKREQARLTEHQKELKEAEAQSANAGPTDSRMLYEEARTRVAVDQARLDSARQKADELRDQAKASDAQVASLEHEMEQQRLQSNEMQTDADMLLVRAEELQRDATHLEAADQLQAQAAALRDQGDSKGADALDAQAAAERAKSNLTDNTTVDDERLEPLGVDIDARFSDADDIVNLGFGEEPAADPGVIDPGVIEMEPMIINPSSTDGSTNDSPDSVNEIGPVSLRPQAGDSSEGAEEIQKIGPVSLDPASVEPTGVEPAEIEMEPMIMEPAAQSDFQEDSFQSDLTDIAAAEQTLDQLTELDG